jgi:peptidase M23-like protein/uncharacterized protein DUF3887
MLRLYAACLCVFLTSMAQGQERSQETFREVAERMVKAINAADYEGMRRDFNNVMLDAFPVEKCKAFFSKEISDKLGKINRLGSPQLKSASVAVIVARCERGTLDITLTLDDRGRVAGMLFRPGSGLPIPERNQTRLTPPFKDRWLVFWGGDTAELNAHHHVPAQRFALDFLGVGPNGKTHQAGASRNEDYFAFGRDVLAPANGVITDVIDGVRDNSPGSMNPLSALGNAVFIRHGTQEVSVLAHLKQGSIKVKVGDAVKKGQVLGQCGNSGNSSEPHIHYHLQDTDVIQDATGIKCYFEQIIVEKKGTKATRESYSAVKGDIISPIGKK